ncbi:MAG: phosphoribosyltransferase family protein [Bacillota bacterium]
MAARKNKKRGFLFVSKVLGKHIPVSPYTPLLTGAALACRYMEAAYGKEIPHVKEIIHGLIQDENAASIYQKIRKNPLKLQEPALFIGFAETATALGHSVFDCFGGDAVYIHTTREQIPKLQTAICFEEEHSHATTHRCYPADQDMFSNSHPIILIDDEITTGKTALNIIEAIQKKYPRKEYGLISILDWRSEEDRQRFIEKEKELGIKIHTAALLGGSIAVEGSPIVEMETIQDIEDILHAGEQEVAVTCLEPEEFDYPIIPFCSIDLGGMENVSPYLQLTGRFGISDTEKGKIDLMAARVGNFLKKKRQGGPTLCLGTGEFMYLPMRIAAHMGDGVKYHSTTRSPIHPYDHPEYGVQNAFIFDCPDDPQIINYFYNIPQGYYQDLFLFLERKVEDHRLKPLYEALKKTGIPRIHMIIFA